MSLGNKGSPLFPHESGVKSQRLLKCHFLVGLCSLVCLDILLSSVTAVMSRGNCVGYVFL